MASRIGRREFLWTGLAGTLTAATLRGDLLGQAFATPAGSAKLSIARAAGAEPAAGTAALARRLTEAAMEGLGGMGRFVSRGDVVWIKANIAWNRRPELAANTHPEVVRSLAEQAFAAGAKEVKIGDNSCQEARLCYETSGIAAVAREVGARMVLLDENRFREMKIGGERLETWPVYPEIIESDLVINVPVVKHHSLSRASLCVKNYMGVIGGRRGTWHQDLPRCLADITAFMKPRLCVLDAVRALKNNGPTGGNPADVIHPRVVAAGTDPVALDAFGVELLGMPLEAVTTVTYAARSGLGTTDYRSLGPVERTLS